MMVKCISLCISVLLFVFTCMKANSKEEESPMYVQYVSEVTSSFLKQMYSEFGLECEASGGCLPYDVEEISVQLVSNQSASVEKAREWEVKTTERFVQIINAHEEIRPFLREYPFPSSRVSVSIAFKASQNKNLSTNQNVAFVFQARNKIFYRARNPNYQYRFDPIRDELYEEARKIVLANASQKTSQ